SNSQLHQTQGELEQSQLELHQTQGELEQSQAQLHQTQGELERLKVPQALHAQADVQSPTHRYRLLLWEGWYAYHKGDLKGTAHFLKESLNCTPLSPTETVLDWLEKFSQFSSEKGVHLDTNSLINSAEWKELMRRSLNGKLSVAVG
ncbi:MAG: chromosome partitioning protein ParA, partial [Microcoleus sp. CAN_BIN18]|nr:chromosome partitioning protein ParA [Microcoleus sp. CAN_BIN18]